MTNLTCRPEREVRFAVVMYGGVSLAVYMNGVARELYHLVRATAPRKDADGAFQLDDATLTPVERAYRELARVADLARPGDAGEAVRTTYLVDVLAGTSAGGINAVFLAKALANDQPFEHLAKLWTEEADLGLLLNDAASAKDVAGLRRPAKPARALLNGERMYRKLLDALDRMDSARPAAARSPFVDDLDLFVTATDLRGAVLPLGIADADVLERRHRALFRFQVRTRAAPDFAREMNPSLAFVARCTSSFPFAFQPISLKDAAALIEPTPHAGALTKGAAARARFDRIAADAFAPAGAASQGVDEDDRVFCDGGVLDNKPFGPALDAIERRRPGLPCDRKLLYVEPSPEHPERDAGRRGDFDALDTAAAAVKLPMNETIREDLRRVLRRNQLLERYDRAREGLERDLARSKREPAQVDAEAWKRDGLGAMIAARGAAYGGYHRLKIGAVTDDLCRWVAAAAGIPSDGDLWVALRMLLRAWRGGKYADHADATHRPDTAFLLDYDLSYRLRRARFLVDQAARLAGDRTRGSVLARLDRRLQQADEPAFAAEMAHLLCELRRTVSDPLEAFARSLSEPPAGDREHPLEPAVGSLRQEPYRSQLSAIVRDRGGEASEPGAVVDGEVTDAGMDARRAARARRVLVDWSGPLDAAEHLLERTLRPALIEAGDALKALLDPERGIQPPAGTAAHVEAQVRPGAGALAARSALRFLVDAFEDYDMALLPLLSGLDAQEVQPIDVHRISPEDARGIIDEREDPRRKLYGTRWAHFAAFLDPRWRVSDQLWGRLDAAERLVEIVLGGRVADPGWKRERDRLVGELWSAIVAEDLEASPTQGIEGIVREKLGTRGLCARGNEERARDVAKALASAGLVKPGQAQVGARLAYLAKDHDSAKDEADRERVIRAAARGSTLVGEMLDGISKARGWRSFGQGFLLRLARFFWLVVELAVPRRGLRPLLSHGFGLLVVASALLTAIGFFLSRDMAIAGALSLATLFVGSIAIQAIRAWIARERSWWVAPATVAAILVAAGALAGGRYLVVRSRAWSDWKGRMSRAVTAFLVRPDGAAAPPSAIVKAVPAPRDLPASTPEELRRGTRYLGVSYAHDDVGTVAFAELARKFPTAVAVDATPRADAGGLTTAFLFTLDRPLDVWRFQRGSGGTLGRWWALEKPPGSTDHIRRDYAICRGWNPLDRLVHCTVAAGTVIAAGPGNDVSCAPAAPDERYDRSPHWQIFVDAEQIRDRFRCDEAAAAEVKGALPARKPERTAPRL